MSIVPLCVYFVAQNDSEASTLLAAMTMALDSMRLPWPVLLPVHDALRDSYWGAAALPGRTVRLQADSVHTSSVPGALVTLQVREVGVHNVYRI